jgi:hypothetical protein
MLLFNNRFNVNKTLSTISGATVLPIYITYWSSTEMDNMFAFASDFYGGSQSAYDKGANSIYMSVRTIRAF